MSTASDIPARDAPHDGMVWVPGGTFLMGSNDYYPEERPAHPRRVAGFWMDRFAVTNEDFGRFVAATGYITSAEQGPAPGSSVFQMTAGPVPLDQVSPWWTMVPGACWRHPAGPGSDIKGQKNLPVIHVSGRDAQAYAGWAGKQLPDEAEWEYAARGGCPDDQIWPWGHHLTDDGKPMANTWQGEFPWQDLALDGFAGIAPADSFAPNGYGLFNMIGNVWEWTTGRFRSDHMAQKSCCSVGRDGTDGPGAERLVIKGGSHLCAPNYCRRYRPAARTPQQATATTNHIGFRCIRRPAG